MTTAMNQCKKALRDEGRPGATVRHREGHPHPDERIDLRAALRTLSARQRQAVVLHYLGDIPIAGVADLMGISEGAVKSHLARGREALRAPLEVADV
jgi:RNA polymerase sigma factor (sigma-70 family)